MQGMGPLDSGSIVGPSTLAKAMRSFAALDVRPMSFHAIGDNRMTRTCTVCGHSETMALLTAAGQEQREDEVMVLAAELDGAMQVCPRCSGPRRRHRCRS